MFIVRRRVGLVELLLLKVCRLRPAPLPPQASEHTKFGTRRSQASPDADPVHIVSVRPCFRLSLRPYNLPSVLPSGLPSATNSYGVPSESEESIQLLGLTQFLGIGIGIGIEIGI